MSGEKTVAHRRHDISDRVWSLLEPHLPGRRGVWAGWLRTTDSLSIRFSGFYAQTRRGWIFRRTMIVALSAGETRESGRNS